MNLPYLPILLHETYIKALWDTGTEKSFIPAEVFKSCFVFRPKRKSDTEVVTAQGAKCVNLVIVELQVRFREFTKQWSFHVIEDMQYQCVLGVDFMRITKISLDFDRKTLVIPDLEIKVVPQVESDLSQTKLNKHENQELQALFWSFGELF
ncbi:uncharacterized protein TNCV_3781171 [Trichonephila clavipes]|nr:uncharacterized protein TNCV_3781171 [Trichonephila clavipes]